MKNIKAVIFDMDGVLIDAREWHFHALNKALSMFGFEILLNDHLNKFDGLPTKKKLEILSCEQNLPSGLHNLINEMKQIYTFQYANAKCAPSFRHEYALSKLKKEGYLLAVASNSIRSSVELMMKNSHLDQWLDLQLSNEDVRQPKPAPDIYLEAAKRFNIKPYECLVVEDNHHGVTAANAAGANVLQVSNPDEVTYETIHSFIEKLER